jgi:hypothetical protein
MQGKAMGALDTPVVRPYMALSRGVAALATARRGLPRRTAELFWKQDREEGELGNTNVLAVQSTLAVRSAGSLDVPKSSPACSMPLGGTLTQLRSLVGRTVRDGTIGRAVQRDTRARRPPARTGDISRLLLTSISSYSGSENDSANLTGAATACSTGRPPGALSAWCSEGIESGHRRLGDRTRPEPALPPSKSRGRDNQSPCPTN